MNHLNKKRSVFGVALVLGLISLAELSYAFDVIDRKTSYHDSKFISLGVGLGMTGFSQQKGIDGGTGFGFRVSAGHHFNQYLEAEISYQMSTFRFSSPDPIDPQVSLRTRAGMNQETIRLIAKYPAVMVQPFLSAGVGGYNLFGVNKETALSFPADFQIPLGAGFRSYFLRDSISFDVEFNYQLLFGENQDTDTLALLGLNKVQFDTYSIMASFTFHMF